MSRTTFDQGKRGIRSGPTRGEEKNKDEESRSGMCVDGEKEHDQYLLQGTMALTAVRPESSRGSDSRDKWPGT